MEKEVIRADFTSFDEWWWEVGSGMPPYLSEDAYKFGKRIAKEAFEAGMEAKVTELKNASFRL